MRLYVGTSGYSYKEWKGTFYPEDLPASKMLPFYASNFSTVEINNTFYRMPTEKLIAGWAAQVPEEFTFVLKAPQRITHQKKLVDAEEDIRHFAEIGSALGPRLGPLLFQLPPYLRADPARLRSLFAALPAGVRPALEFRHESWKNPEVNDTLREHGSALCVSDTDEMPFGENDPLSTANWGYVRLRRVVYEKSDLAQWRDRIKSTEWEQAYVFFKHEDEGTGPRLAKEFLELWDQ
jgi:uncharacterized protein YecE (DUF72 family)